MADEKKTPKKRDESLGALFRHKHAIEAGDPAAGHPVVGGSAEVSGPVETVAEKPTQKRRKVRRSTPESRARKDNKQKRKFSF